MTKTMIPLKERRIELGERIRQIREEIGAAVLDAPDEVGALTEALEELVRQANSIDQADALGQAERRSRVGQWRETSDEAETSAKRVRYYRGSAELLRRQAKVAKIEAELAEARNQLREEGVISEVKTLARAFTQTGIEFEPVPGPAGDGRHLTPAAALAEAKRFDKLADAEEASVSELSVQAEELRAAFS